MDGNLELVQEMRIEFVDDSPKPRLLLAQERKATG
jgi:hypothetical protein